MQASDTRDFLLGVIDETGSYSLFGFKCRVNTFSRDNRLAFVLEDERRVLPVEHKNVNLLAECPSAVHYESLSSLIPLWKIGLEQFEPDLFAGVAFCYWVSERCTCNFQALLDIVMESRQQLEQ